MTPVIDSNANSPFPLSQVCQEWRNIVINSASLWTSICVYEPSRKHLYRLELWLERSRNRTLSILIKESVQPSMEELEATGLIIGMLSQHRRRWFDVSFQLAVPPVSLVRAFEDFRFEDPTCHWMLAELNLYFIHEAEMTDNTDVTARASTLFTYINDMRRLQSLKWVCPLWTPVRWTPKPHLQALQLITPTHVNEVIQFLQYSPRLICFEARDIYMDDPSRPPDAPDITTLLKLTHIHLRFRKPRYLPRGSPLAQILSRIRAPKLSQLLLEHILPAPRAGAHSTSDLDAVRSFLEASRCELRGIDVDIPGVRTDELLRWLALPGINDLQLLYLCGGRIDPALLEALTLRDEREASPDAPVRNRFPLLRQLGLARCGAEDEDTLLRMAESRFWPPENVGELEGRKGGLQSLRVWVRQRSPGMDAYARKITSCGEKIEEGNTPEEKRECEFLPSRR